MSRQSVTCIIKTYSHIYRRKLWCVSPCVSVSVIVTACAAAVASQFKLNRLISNHGFKFFPALATINWSMFLWFCVRIFRPKWYYWAVRDLAALAERTQQQLLTQCKCPPSHSQSPCCTNEPHRTPATESHRRLSGTCFRKNVSTPAVLGVAWLGTTSVRLAWLKPHTLGPFFLLFFWRGWGGVVFFFFFFAKHIVVGHLFP